MNNKNDPFLDRSFIDVRYTHRYSIRTRREIKHADIRARFSVFGRLITRSELAYCVRLRWYHEAVSELFPDEQRQRRHSHCRRQRQHPGLVLALAGVNCSRTSRATRPPSSGKTGSKLISHIMLMCSMNWTSTANFAAIYEHCLGFNSKFSRNKPVVPQLLAAYQDGRRHHGGQHKARRPARPAQW